MELPLVLVVAIVALTVAFAATSSKLICILNMNADNYIYMLVNRLKSKDKHIFRMDATGSRLQVCCVTSMIMI